jgi:hypothetical protein
VQHILQVHIINFNHEYLITPHSHVATVMLPCCLHAALMLQLLPLYCRRCHHAVMLLPPHCRHRYAVATTALPPPPPAIKLLPPPLPPCCRHFRWHCQAAAAATKVAPLPLSILQDRFDNEKEFCKMTDVDFFQFS